jgi:hypothetical protein
MADGVEDFRGTSVVGAPVLSCQGKMCQPGNTSRITEIHYSPPTASDLSDYSAHSEIPMISRAFLGS